MSAKYRWVVIFQDGTTMTFPQARGQRVLAYKAYQLTGKFVAEVRKIPTAGSGLVYKSYRYR